jgi:hypothetical protein
MEGEAGSIAGGAGGRVAVSTEKFEILMDCQVRRIS